MVTYRVFTVASGAVTEGAEIGTLHLKGAGIDIPAILIGEEGRGRERGVVPVGGEIPPTACPRRGQELSGSYCPQCTTHLGAGGLHPDEGDVPRRILAAEVGTTKAGKPKLVARPEATSGEKIVVVFRTGIGFRGGNSHTGDRAGWKCVAGHGGPGDVPDACPECGEARSWDRPQLTFLPFPGEILARGVIAQGAAGRAGSGEQLVAVLPKGVVFRTGYGGRLYGAPSAHFYQWDGEKLLAATWEERAASDLF